MNDDAPIDDTLLSAWVDGELDAADRDRVDAWLRDNPDDAARVRAWQADRQALRALFEPVADEPLPPAIEGAAWRRSGPPRWALAAAAAGLLLAGGVVGALVARQTLPRQFVAIDAPRAWTERAAVAHAIYVPEPRHAVEVRAQEEHLSRWLTARIRTPVKLFDLRSDGFDLVGGRLLPDGAAKSAQLMYQDAQGVRVTVYLRRPEENAETAFRYERHGDLGLFYWVDAGCGYALVGALPRERLLALAESIYRQHPGATPARP